MKNVKRIFLALIVVANLIAIPVTAQRAAAPLLEIGTDCTTNGNGC